MIDGFQIKTTQYSVDYWKHNSGFDFLSKCNEKTNSIIGNGSYTEYNGLYLSAYAGRKENRDLGIKATPDSCHIRGSLARFYNNGGDNAFDFTMNMVKESLDLMENSFDLDFQQCELRGLEVGFNIEVPTTVNKILGNIKQINDSSFTSYKDGRFSIGLVSKRQQYELKFYDKGKVANKTNTNLLRMEIKVNKTIYLKKYGITGLTDLKDTTKVKRVALAVVDKWRNSIFIEPKIQYRNMTNYEQKKWLYYSNATNWDSFKTRVQKYKAKEYYNRLIKDYCSDSMKDKITKLMLEKIEFLTADNCIRFNQELEKTTTDNCLRFNPYDNVLKRIQKPVDFENLKISKKEGENEVEKKRYCITCKSELKGKREGAIYCSKKCKDKHNGMRKTKANRERIKEEKKKVGVLIHKIAKSDLWLRVSYRHKGKVYTDYLHQTEILTGSDWINKVVKINIEHANHKGTELNGIRAKQLIRSINKFNLVQVQTINLENTGEIPEETAKVPEEIEKTPEVLRVFRE